MKLLKFLALLGPCYLLMCLFTEYVSEATRTALALAGGLVLAMLLLALLVRRWTGKPQ